MPSNSSSRSKTLTHRELAVRWPSAEARDWAERTLAELCKDHAVLAVVLFGSSVRPVDVSSDLDCLVVFSGNRPKFAPAPVDVDVRSYESSSVRRLILEGHDLLGWALRLGVLACERQGFWSRLRAELLPGLALPSPEVAERRAEQSARLLHELRAIGDVDASAEQELTLLTHQARAALLRAGVFPPSRPELPAQLRAIGESTLARDLDAALEDRQRRAVTFVG